MKTLRIGLCALCVALFTALLIQGAQLTVNIGSTPNDGTGDTLRTAFGKVNTNFTELYGYIGSAGLVAHCNNYAEMQAVNPTNARVAIVHGHTLRGDGGGGVFFPTNSLSATNFGTRIVSTNYLTWSWQRIYSGPLDVRWFGAKGDGATDDAAAFQRTFDAASGATILAPAGTYRINSMITNVTTAATTYSPGLRLHGEGSEKTIFDTRVASNPMLKIDTTAVAQSYFQRGVELRGFKISGEFGNPASADGIFLRHAYDVIIEDVRIKTLTGTGIHIRATEGDNDGCNMVALDTVRIEGCSGWGINVDCDSGINEVSFLGLENVFVTECGVDSATSPAPSGAFRWKGQVLNVRNSAFAANNNVGFLCYGAAGLANNAHFESTTFENNRRRSVHITGLDIGTFINCQVVNNDSFISTNGFLLDGASFVVRNVTVLNTLVKATSGNNAYTFYTISGGNAQYCRLENTSWNDFGHAGQTRFSAAETDSIVHIVDDGIPRHLDIARTLRVMQNTQVAPATGRGLELFHASGVGNILSYNRAGGAYDTTAVDGSTVRLQSSGTNTALAQLGGELLLSKTYSYAAPGDLTIATGAITVTLQRHLVDTEASAASDDLDTVNGTAQSRFLVISPKNDARTIVVKHNTGNILCAGNADITLDDAHDYAMLIYDNALSKWMAK